MRANFSSPCEVSQMKKLLFVFAVSLMITGFAFAEPVPSVKALIAVDNFRNDSCHAREWWKVPTGGDISASLISQLKNSGKFDIVSNDITSDQIMAKDLDINGRILQNSALRVGQNTGVQYIVMFQVNGFEEKVTAGQKPAFSFGGGSDEVEGAKTLSVEVNVINAATGKAEFTNIRRQTPFGWLLPDMLCWRRATFLTMFSFHRKTAIMRTGGGFGLEFYSIGLRYRR